MAWTNRMTRNQKSPLSLNRGLFVPGRLERQAPGGFLWRSALSRKLLLPLAGPRFFTRPHLIFGETPGLLWSAGYPCRYLRLSPHFWTRQCPRFFRFPVRFLEVGLVRTALDFNPVACPLTQTALSPLGSGAILYQLIDSHLLRRIIWVSSGLLIPLLAFRASSIFAGPNRTPRFNAIWTDSPLLDNPDAIHVRFSGFVSLRHPSQSLASNFLLAAPDWTPGTPRFPRSRHRVLL